MKFSQYKNGAYVHQRWQCGLYWSTTIVVDVGGCKGLMYAARLLRQTLINYMKDSGE